MIHVNSIYVNDGQTVVTLFVGNDNKMAYVVSNVDGTSLKEEELEVEISSAVFQEMQNAADEVWGFQKNLYCLRLFALSKELCQFILHCWHEVRKREKQLFV